MTTEQMVTLILSILIPMLTGFGWVINKMMKMDEKNSDDFAKITSKLSLLDSRISRIEGYIEGRDRSIIKVTGTDKN
jgi:hypothetical protein